MPAVTIIQLRRSTASGWTTNNPTLAQGEEGYETDTGKIKIGDGITAWSSLPYGGPTGPSATQVLESFGDGSDGNLTVSSGLTTLTRDMFWNNLTINSTGQINTVGYKIFVAGTLDISAAGTAAIYNSGGNGGNTNNQNGGAVGTAPLGATVGAPGAGSSGATGVIGAGVQAPAAVSGGNGGSGNAAGASGNGGTNASPTSGAAGRAGAAVASALPIRRFEQNLIRGATLITSASGGSGGSAGSGDGTTLANSCGGGGGGAGGGIVAIWANTINRSNSTGASAIQVTGGVGGNARSALGIYTFTISAGSTASVGTTYTNNSQTFVVTTAVTSSSTTVITQIMGAGVPTNTGTLTLASGTGSSTITYTAVAASSGVVNGIAGVGGGGGGSGGGGGWIFLQYNTLSGSTGTNILDASGGNGGIGGCGANNYTFTITAGQTASIGATFTNNSQTFYVTTSLTGAQTTLITVGTGAPSASGTLTKANGTSSANITYSAFTGGTTASGGGGGSGGNGGRVTLLQVTTSTGSESFTGTGTTGGSASGIFGGNMGAGSLNMVSL
jgi:hypothetical protein